MYYAFTLFSVVHSMMLPTAYNIYHIPLNRSVGFYVISDIFHPIFKRSRPLFRGKFLSFFQCALHIIQVPWRTLFGHMAWPISTLSHSDSSIDSSYCLVHTKKLKRNQERRSLGHRGDWHSCYIMCTHYQFSGRSWKQHWPSLYSRSGFDLLDDLIHLQPLFGSGLYSRKYGII